MSTKKTLAALDKYHSGCDALASGFIAEAIQAFTDAISYDPTNALFFVRRSQAHSMKKDTSSTTLANNNNHEASLAGSLNSALGISRMGGAASGGNINAGIGGALEAIDDANKALKIDPTNPECYVRRGECCLIHEGDAAGCIKILEKAKERNATTKKTPATVKGEKETEQAYVPLLLLEAEVALIKRQFATVASVSQLVLKQNATSEESIKASKYLYIANAALNATGAGDKKKTEGDGGGPSASSPAANLDNHDAADFISCLVASGQECFAAGNIQQAIHHWNNALLLSTAVDSPGFNKILRTKLAAAYRAIGRADLSGEIGAGSSSQQKATTSAACMDKGNTQFAAKNYKAALGSFLKAAELDLSIGNQAGYAAAWNNVACVYFAMKKYKEALHYFEKQKNLAMEEHDVVRLVASNSDMAECYLHLNMHSQAHAKLAECLALQEDLHMVTVLETENDESSSSSNGGGTSATSTNLVESYLVSMQRVYGIAIQLYLKVGKPAVALEWMERAKSLSFFQDTLSTKSSAAELDVDIEELQQKATETNSAILSFFIGGSSPGVVDGVLLTPDGVATHKAVSMEVLRLINPGCIVSEQKTMLQDNEDSSTGAAAATAGGAGDDEPTSPKAQGTSDPAIRRFRYQYQGLIAPFQKLLFGGGQDQPCKFNSLVVIPHGPLFGVSWNSLLLNSSALKLLNKTTATTTTSENTLGGLVPIAVACTAASWFHCAKDYENAKELISTSVALINDPSIPTDAGLPAPADAIGENLKGSGSTVEKIEKTDSDKNLSDVFKKVSQKSKVVHVRARVCLKKLLSKPGTSNIKILGVPSVMPKSNRRERDVSTNCVATEELVQAAAPLSGGTLLAGASEGAVTKTSPGWIFIAKAANAPYLPTARVSEVLPDCAISLSCSYPPIAVANNLLGPQSSDPLTSFIFPKGSVVVLDLHGSEVDAAAAKVDHIRALRAAGAALVVAPVNIAVEHATRHEYLNLFYSNLLGSSRNEKLTLVQHVGHALFAANRQYIDTAVAKKQPVTALTDWAGYSVYV